jgi:hypothetical protein
VARTLINPNNLNLNLLDSVERALEPNKTYSVVEFAEEACNRRLYPRQALLLKLIFLEPLTEEEERDLDYWIAGGDNGTEVLISPYIRERIAWLRKRQFPNFREIVLVGGRRCSKGYLVGICLAYQMYRAMKMDIHKQFGIEEDKQVYFSCISASQDQAKRFQYADFADTVTACTLMQSNIFKVRELEFSVMTESDKRKMLSLEKSGTKIGRDISTMRGVAWASNAKTVRGSATLAVAMDEMAHMQAEGESYMTSAQVYDALIPSLAQFGKWALILLSSSPFTKIGKFYERHTEALKVKDNKPLSPAMFTIQMPSWFLFANYWRDPQKRFKRAITVSPDWDPDKTENGVSVFCADDKDNIIIERQNERQDPEMYKVERRAQWAEVLDSFLRHELVERAFLGKPDKGGYIPLRTNWSNPDPRYKYICHLDPSSTTAAFGFALGHIEYLEQPDMESGENKRISHLVVDIVQRWRASAFESGIVDYEVVLNEIMQYIILFRPQEVSLDQFQNAAIIGWLNKELRQRNLTATRVFERTATNKNNWDVACVFRDALYQDRIHLPNDTADSDWLALELKNLQQINTAGRHPRVTHPEAGNVQTSDVYSAVSQVCFALLGEEIAGKNRRDIGEMHMELGAQGGFSIGNRMTRRPFPRVSGDIANKLSAYYAGQMGSNGGGNPALIARQGTWAKRGALSRRTRRY